MFLACILYEQIFFFFEMLGLQIGNLWNKRWVMLTMGFSQATHLVLTMIDVSWESSLR